MSSALSSRTGSQLFPAASCIIAAVLWGVFWYPLRILEEMGWHGLWSALLMYIIALVMIIIPCWEQRAEILNDKINYALLGLFAGWSNLAFALALLEGEVVRVLLLFYLSPVWAILLAFFILKERPTKVNSIALVMAMIGASMMLWRPGYNYIGAVSLADFYAITAGMAFAIMNIVIRKTGDVPTRLKMVSSWLGVIAITIAGLLITQIPMPQISFNSGLLLFLLGFPFLFIVTWTAQYGVTHLPIQRSSILFLSEIVAGAISAALLTDEIVRNAEYFGGFLIISAGLISVFKGKDRNNT